MHYLSIEPFYNCKIPNVKLRHKSQYQSLSLQHLHSQNRYLDIKANNKRTFHVISVLKYKVYITRLLK